MSVMTDDLKVYFLVQIKGVSGWSAMLQDAVRRVFDMDDYK